MSYKPSLLLDARMYNFSGIGRYIKLLLNFLPKYFDVTLFSYEGDIVPNSCKIVELKSKIYSPLEQIELKLKVKKTDVFWTPHFNSPFFNIPAKVRIATIHDIFHLSPLNEISKLKKYYAKLLIENTILKSNLIFTVSNFTKEEVVKYFKLKDKDAEKIKPIWLAIDDDFFNSCNGDLDSQYGDFILYVGNVKKHKNILGLLKAFQILSSKLDDINLVIVGKKENFISGNIREEEIGRFKDRVFFKGVVNDKELRYLYSKASGLVLPSFYEGFGLPPLEALLCGCPVALSDIPVFKEVYGETALYFNPNDPTDIAQKVYQLIKDKDLREKILFSFSEKKKIFSIERMEKEYITVLKSLGVIA